MAATLATTLLVMFGVFLVYTYISVVFDRATGGDGAHLAALISVWGIAGGLVMGVLGPHDLSFVSTLLILGGIATAELAHRLIRNGGPSVVRAPQGAEPARR